MNNDTTVALTQPPTADTTGLTSAEAAQRLLADGPNALPTEKPRATWRIAFEVVCEPMFLMLVSAGALYLVMGELSDAVMLMGCVLVVMGITIVQERRTENALGALRTLSAPKARALRDGVQRRVDAHELVRGDVVALSEGDRVPADGVLRQGLNLTVDESLLTGESVPVRKTAVVGARSLDRPGGDDLPSVFFGSLVVAGHGLAEIVATGLRSELGKIGKALDQAAPEKTFLQRETTRFVRIFALVGLLACAMVVVVFATTRGGSVEIWKQGLLAGISMAMSLLPEEFPVVMTVFLALGALRISASRVLTRRMPAIESLGAATVLCVDKTGTLTENKMTLRALQPAGVASVALPDTQMHSADALHLLDVALQASNAQGFDPMDRALVRANTDHAMVDAPAKPSRTLLREYPLTPQRLAVTQVWSTGAGALEVAVKGAPETVLDLCKIEADERTRALKDTEALAASGLRVLAVAHGTVASSVAPDDPASISLSFVGLIGFEDPLRSTVPAAVAECRAAGVRVMMITGDYPITATSIAKQAGLENPSNVLSGADLDALSDSELDQRLSDVQVFARVVPAQKLRIVNLLKAKGEVVAMTGDGVNDAPALKAAHIGIAMGGRGSDVARESASLILLDDDFSSIVAAIRLGRRIYDNIKRAVAFILAVHVPIAGLSIVPVFFADWPLLLLPIHVVVLELIIDPACTLIFEAEAPEANVMSRPPRPATERLFSRWITGIALVQGFGVLAACLVVRVTASSAGSDDQARALTFTTLVAGILMVILVNRSWTRSAWSMLRQKNSALLGVLFGAIALLSVAVWVPAAQRFFHFAHAQPLQVAFAAVAGVLSVAWFDVAKAVVRRARPTPSTQLPA